MPITLTATYSDMSGFSCASATVSLKLGDEILYTEECAIVGTSITSSIDATEYLPENNTEYTIEVSARSSSSLQTVQTSTFLTNFTEPAPGSLSITNDTDAGTVQVTASYDNSGAVEPAVAVSIVRQNADGTTTMLLDHGANGDAIIDKYAPLNTPYKYLCITHASSEAICTVEYDNKLKSNRWFVYWGENIASAIWNPENTGIQMTRPQKTRVYYVGRKDPVSYDGSALAFTENPSWMFLELGEVQPFIRLMEDGGRGVYKSCDGMVYHADFELNLSPEYTAIGYYGRAALSIVKIAGRQL